MSKRKTALKIGLGLGLSLIAASSALAQDRSQSRSMVMAKGGIVASESVLASQVGASILEQGGNAIDAAIATNAMMGLIAPMNDGIGGDLFAIIYEAESGRTFGLNASGWAPQNLTPDFLRSQGITRMPSRGIHSVTVPGTVDGWEMMRARFGNMSFAEILAPAIFHAEEGIVVGEIVSAYWRDSVTALRADAPTAQTFLTGGRAYQAGDVFRDPDLGWSYRQIAEHGSDAFYTGEVAQKIIATSQRHGGTMQMSDLAEFSSEWVNPISTEYHGWTVYELPPNGQGIAALEMLNIMERFPLASYGHNSLRALHTMIEAKKLAYADMIQYNGDPNFSYIPVDGMRSKAYAETRAALIDAARANCTVPAGLPPGTDNGTTYLSVVDGEGNMVSLIQSNFSTIGFGASLVVEGAGFVLQNRGGLFNLVPTHPNELEGRKRPIHTIIPAFMESGDTKIAFGIMGGWNQAQAHAQFVSNIVDFGMNVQGALDAPRFSKVSFPGCDVSFEARISEDTRNELAAMGHEILMRGDFSSTRMGSGQAVQRDLATGINSGASDPRKDGAAIAELARPAAP